MNANNRQGRPNNRNQKKSNNGQNNHYKAKNQKYQDLDYEFSTASSIKEQESQFTVDLTGFSIKVCGEV